MSVSLVSALVSQLVLVYVSSSMSAVRECSPWWYVFVSVSGWFWHFFTSLYRTSPKVFSFTCLPFYSVLIYFYLRRYQLVTSDRGWSLASGRKALTSSGWRRFVVQGMEVGNVGISLGSLAGFRFFWGFRCVGELEVICT